MFKSIASFAIVTILVGGGYSHSLVHGKTDQTVNLQTIENSVKEDPKPEICHLDKSHQSDKSVIASMGQTILLQEQQQQQQESQQPESDKHCERPNPDDGANPDVGGTDPKKIGCACARKCENGRPTENYEEDKRCKVHCKPANCDCPNPCLKT